MKIGPAERNIQRYLNTEHINIPNIKSKFVFPGHRISTIHLRPTGNSRANVMPSRLFGVVTIQIAEQKTEIRTLKLADTEPS